jgi:zinc protease
MLFRLRFFSGLVFFVLQSVFAFVYGSDSYSLGELSNGLKYYIQRNQFPEAKASLRLVVNVGSIYETEEERGIAHFLEHMVFRGSKNFADWEVINYLESIGAHFGPDTNAYTSFGETCFMLEIPLDKPDALEKAVLILSDFAFRADLKDELIEIERGVVLDEYNINKSSPRFRFHEKVYDKFFKDSAYYNRLPIGTKDVILKSDPEILRNFYKKWYVPNRMAVIAVGNFDVSEVESFIKKCFSESEAVKQEELDLRCDFENKTQSLIYKDEEQSYLELGFWQFFQTRCPFIMDEEYLKNELNREIFRSILNQRLQKLSQQVKAPFLGAFMSLQYLTSVHYALQFTAYAYQGRPFDAIIALAKEVITLKQLGPTSSELETIKQMLINELSDSELNQDRISNNEIAKAYIKQFLCGFSSYNFKDTIHLQKQYAESLTVEDLIDWAAQNIHFEKMNPVFFLPSGHSSDELDNIEDKLKSLKLEANEKPKESHVNELIIPVDGFGEITQFKENNEIGYVDFFVNDRQRVILYPTKAEKGRIVVRMIAKGGKTLFDSHFYECSQLIPDYLMLAGISNLNGSEMKDHLSRKSIGLSFTLDANKRDVFFSGNTNEAEEIFKCIRGIFLHQRKDSEIFDLLSAFKNELDAQSDASFDKIIKNKVNGFLFNNHPFFDDLSHSDLIEEDFQEAFNYALSSPEDFIVVVAGDFELSQMTSYILSYLNFPASKPQANLIKIPNIPIIDKDQSVTFHKGKHTHGMTYVGYRKKFSNFEPKECQMVALSYMLKDRIVSKLRKQFGETYSPSVHFNYPYHPNLSEICISVVSSADPRNLEGVTLLLKEILDEFALGGPTLTELENAKEILRQEIKSGKNYIRYWASVFSQTALKDMDIALKLQEEESLDVVNMDEMKKVAKELFYNNPKYTASLYPES